MCDLDVTSLCVYVCVYTCIYKYILNIHILEYIFEHVHIAKTTSFQRSPRFTPII